MKPRMRGGALLLTACLSFTSLVALSACGGSANRAVTSVAQEELFRTGNFNYDEFFEDVYGLQASAHRADEDDKAARAPLARALGIGDVPLERLLASLQAVVDGQAQGKARVHFRIDGVDEQGIPLPGRAIIVTAAATKARALPKDAAELTLAIAQTAKAEGQVWEKYGPLPDKGRRLTEKAAALEPDVSGTFASEPKAKREQIERELSAAKSVAAEIAARTDKVSKAASTFLKRTNELFVAAASAEVKPPPKAPPKGKSTAPAVGPAKAHDDSKPVPAKPPPAARKKPQPASAAGEVGTPDFNP
jgi:hypothetical protein